MIHSYCLGRFFCTDTYLDLDFKTYHKPKYLQVFHKDLSLRLRVTSSLGYQQNLGKKNIIEKNQKCEIAALTHNFFIEILEYLKVPGGTGCNTPVQLFVTNNMFSIKKS